MRCCGKHLDGYRCPTCGKDHRGEKPKEGKLIASDASISFVVSNQAPLDPATMEEHRKSGVALGAATSSDCTHSSIAPFLSMKRDSGEHGWKCDDCGEIFFKHKR